MHYIVHGHRVWVICLFCVVFLLRKNMLSTKRGSISPSGPIKELQVKRASTIKGHTQEAQPSPGCSLAWQSMLQRQPMEAEGSQAAYLFGLLFITMLSPLGSSLTGASTFCWLYS